MKGYTSTMVDQEEPAAAPAESVTDGKRIIRHKNGDIEVQGAGTMQARIPKAGDFDENLAGTIHMTGKGLADRLVDFSEVDKESRKDWEEREKRGLEMLGIKDTIAKPDQKSPGMNTMTHPMMMEACVRFSSNAITEIFPAEGPAKTKILGTRTKEKVAQADRIEMFSNYYLTEVDREYFADTDQMLFYLSISGSAFRKGGQNWITGMPELRYVKATNFIAPYAGTDLKSMPRYAHEFTMTGDDIRRAIGTGMFADAQLMRGSNDAKHAPSSDTADGRINVQHEDDELYTLLEYHIDLALDDPLAPIPKGDDWRDHVRPYIVVVEVESRAVLCIRRNWRQNDKSCQKRMWWAHHKYLPGLGFYGFGLPHVIGSLANAASGAVNAILDASQMATFQGGFKTKEGKNLAGELRLEAGVYKDVDATYEDLQKAFFNPPFKEPGPALPALLANLVEAGQRFAGTSDAAVGDASNMGPVGTTIALIEQSQKPQSAIHKRLHKSMSDELRMFSELVHDFMPDRYDYTIGGDAQFLLKQDFNGHVNVVSVTDPNISSNTQRIQQAQAVDQTMQQHPDLFTPKKRALAVMRIFEALKIPDIEEIKPEAETPMYLDAVTENGLILRGKMVRVYETQDDAAHLQIHQHGMATVAAAPGMDPQTQQMIMASYGVHIRDHQAMLYRKQIMAGAGIKPPPLDLDGEPIGMDPQTEAMLTAAVVAKLPPPPPPPAPPQQGPNPAEKAQMEVQAKQTLTAAEVDRQNKLAAADHERKTQAFLEEEARKEQAHKRQLQRADELAQADKKRKDALAASQLIREGAKAGVKHRTDLKTAQVHTSAARESADIQLKTKAEEARLRLQQMKQEAEQKRRDMRDQARQRREEAKVQLAAKKAAAKAKPKAKAKQK